MRDYTPAFPLRGSRDISQGYINNNIWHLHPLSIDESQSNVQEIRVSLRYTL